MLNEIDLSRTDLNLLVLFEAVLDERHVGRAAERMNLTPSAVSHGLGRLRRLLNDPLFLRTPKGVVPTARAVELAATIADILAQTRRIVSASAPFDPATSTRCFTIGAPDAVSAVMLPPLLAGLKAAAPSIDLRLRQLLPPIQSREFDRAWEPVLAELETRAVDIAIVPLKQVPARFVAHTLFEEDFVIAARQGHAFAKRPSLEHFCTHQQLVVSLTGDAHGLVDKVLAKHGLSRRVALTVPNFMMALALIAQTDLIGAMPRSLLASQAARFGLMLIEPPVPFRRDSISAVATKAALMDAGVAWLYRALQDTALGKTARASKRR